MNVRPLEIALVLAFATAAVASGDAPLTVEEAHLTDYWTRIKNEGRPSEPLYPKAAVRVGASGCVAVAFTVDADGKVGSERILNSFISKKDGDEIRAEFEKSVLANLPYWRFAPTAANARHQPIHTYITVTAVAELGLHSKTFQAEIAARCKVENFAAPTGAPDQSAEQKS